MGILRLISIIAPVVAVAIFATIKVAGIINEKLIIKNVKKRNKDAFKALIKEKKKYAVNVGIFDEEEENIGNIEIKSDEGVSDSLYVGQVIYI
jgi:anionic cell wall polymer biosynthesis LytR-Cps2A-Psr (LCP) family protein